MGDIRMLGWLELNNRLGGVRMVADVTIFSKKESTSLRDRELCSVSSGRMAGTPALGSIAVTK